VFRVCEDQHVIRTSDGAEAGHVEYIVVEPGSRQIVSTVITGGVTGARLVAVPYQSLHFQGEREVTLTEINRERLVSAPVIEKTQLTTTTRFEPALVERSFTHFNVRADAAATTTRERATTETDATRRTTEQPARTTRESTAATTRERATTETDATRRTTEQPGRTTRESAATQREATTPPAGETRERKDTATDRSQQSPPKTDAQQSQPKADREQSESAREKAARERSEAQREGKSARELPEGEKANRSTPKDTDRAGEQPNAQKDTSAKEHDQSKKAPAEKSDKPVREETEKPERTPPKQ
jgi:hypothetical protein